MAFPTVEDLVITEFPRQANKFVAMPDVVLAGELLLMPWGSNGSADTNTPTGWTKKASGSNSDALEIFAKVADGSEGGTTVNFSTPGSDAGTGHVYRISGWSGDLDDVEIELDATQGGTAPDPPSLTASGGSADNLWIVALNMNDGSDLVNTYPANYTNGNESQGNATGLGSNTLATCRRENATATENPGAFSTSTSSHVVATIVIPPGASDPITAAVSGTITDSTDEDDIVVGGKTIIITIENDTWVTAGATFNAARQAIIDGLDSAQEESNGWNAQVRDGLAVTAVVRTSDTVVTITLTAFPNYNITGQETITVTVPASAVSEGIGVTATPTFTIDPATASGGGGDEGGGGGGGSGEPPPAGGPGSTARGSAAQLWAERSRNLRDLARRRVQPRRIV